MQLPSHHHPHPIFTHHALRTPVAELATGHPPPGLLPRSSIGVHRSSTEPPPFRTAPESKTLFGVKCRLSTKKKSSLTCQRSKPREHWPNARRWRLPAVDGRLSKHVLEDRCRNLTVNSGNRLDLALQRNGKGNGQTRPKSRCRSGRKWSGQTFCRN